jgi:hypothetical protein
MNPAMVSSLCFSVELAATLYYIPGEEAVARVCAILMLRQPGPVSFHGLVTVERHVFAQCLE